MPVLDDTIKGMLIIVAGGPDATKALFGGDAILFPLGLAFLLLFTEKGFMSWARDDVHAMKVNKANDGELTKRWQADKWLKDVLAPTQNAKTSFCIPFGV